MAYRYRAHGLGIVSDVELPLPPGDGASDVTLRLGGAVDVPHRRPEGTPLAELSREGGRLFYALARAGERTVLRYPELAEFTGDAGLADVTAHPHRGADPGLLPVLASGTLLAVHLLLRRHLVLHASAVEAEGRALAFVGASGMGKSTLAAALCGAGCGLVADDVLRVDPASADGFVVHPGSTESRLRPNARQLADSAPSSAVRPTADGRLALRPGTHADGPLPLTACVVPRPSREAADVVLRRVPPSRALLWLCRFPRVLGWSDPSSLGHTFQALGDLVERVPLFEATVPWGPPFRPEISARLLEALAEPARV
ncbi:hypothetical protein [Prauserella flavalba]|uniref:hypothetical protein n=1 Tax=Prauserella flavalba TaxID=1477506 RepID=UPI0036EEC631